MRIIWLRFKVYVFSWKCLSELWLYAFCPIMEEASGGSCSVSEDADRFGDEEEVFIIVGAVIIRRWLEWLKK